MDKELVNVPIGDFGKLGLSFKKGELVFTTNVAWSGLSAGVMAGISAKELGKALKQAIPGAVDDAIIDVIVLALENLPDPK